MATFRRIEKRDIPDLFRVRTATRENRVTIEYLRDQHGITRDSLAEALEGTLRGWCAIENDGICGFVMADGRTGEITVLAVLPDYEGRGLGKGLMQLAQDWLLRHHDEIWLMTTHDPALRAYGFYQALGWRPSGELTDDEEKFLLRRGLLPQSH